VDTPSPDSVRAQVVLCKNSWALDQLIEKHEDIVLLNVAPVVTASGK
jgi:hypothetical protein